MIPTIPYPHPKSSTFAVSEIFAFSSSILVPKSVFSFANIPVAVVSVISAPFIVVLNVFCSNLLFGFGV